MFMLICLILYLLFKLEWNDFKNFSIVFGEIVWILILVFFMFLKIYSGDLIIFILRFFRIFDNIFEFFGFMFLLKYFFELFLYWYDIVLK